MERQAERLQQKIAQRSAKVAVFGLGYVGLPLAVEKARSGFAVVGIDRKAERVDQVNRGVSYIPDVESAVLGDLVRQGLIRAYLEKEAAVLAEADIIIICVPTPLTKNYHPDLSFVEKVTDLIAAHLRPGHLVILESTTYPGTTRQVILPRLEQSGLIAGKDFFLAFSPERVDPGNRCFTTRNTAKVVGGATPQCREAAAAFYGQTIEQVIPVSSPEAAELTKIFENTYRAVNIALVNELAMLCDAMQIDVWEVLEAAATKPFGIQVFYPGPGVGGHCIPIDPFYLAWKAREYDFPTRFIELAGEINVHMPYYVAERVARALNERQKSVSGSRLLLLGVAYKKDVNDHRESPALKIIELLARRGAAVFYHDPHIPEVSAGGAIYRSLELTPEALSSFDCVIITTDHSAVDYGAIVQHARLILDTRNATGKTGKGQPNVIKL